MAISRALMKNLIDDRQLIISPYDGSCFVSNHYELHINRSIKWYEQQYNENTTIDGRSLPPPTTVGLTSHGYVLEPGRQYIVPLKESVRCDLYNCQLTAHSELAHYGLHVTVENEDAVGSGGIIDAVVTVTYPIRVYPDMKLCDMYVNESDTGLGALPIGGIIAWSGGAIPYGYCLCDGSNGSPNLIGHFIRGAAHNGGGGAIICAEYPVHTYYDLMYIMRYK